MPLLSSCWDSSRWMRYYFIYFPSCPHRPGTPFLGSLQLLCSFPRMSVMFPLAPAGLTRPLHRCPLQRARSSPRPSSWPPGPSYRAVPHAWAVSYFFGQCPSFMLTDLSSYFLFRRPLHRCPPQWARFRGPLMVSPNPSSCLQALAPRAVPRTRAVSSPQLHTD